MNAVYVNIGDGTMDQNTTGLFGTNTVGSPNGNGYTILSPNRAAALSNTYTLPDSTVITPKGTLTLAANDAAGATGVVNTGPAASVAMTLALDNAPASGGTLVYQFDGQAAQGARLLNFGNGILIERTNASAASVVGQLKSNTHIASLTLNNSTTFDLVNHALAVESAGSLAAYLSNGQLFSSSVNNDPNHVSAIAKVLGTDLGLSGSTTGTFGGMTLNAASIVYAPAFYGDINLNGKVDADDYILMDRSVAKHLPANWINGDFNNDAVVNGQDYFLMDKAFALTNGARLSPDFLAQRESQFGQDYVDALVASVPEPTALAASASLGLAVVARRRRRRHA
jgi:hypothetical protein